MKAENSLNVAENHLDSPDVVCFGMLAIGILLVVDKWPPQNDASIFQENKDIVCYDAAMIACMLRGWNVKNAMIGTAVGQDYRGQWIATQLKQIGVLGEVRLDPQLETVFSVVVSDPTGARTVFWQPNRKVLATLDTADLSLLQGSRLLYVDWYDEDHIIRPMDEAIRLDIPVFLNLEHKHKEPEILARYAGRATICQAVTDFVQLGNEPPLEVAKKLLAVGVEIAVVTLAKEGCLVVRGKEIIRVWAPSIKAIDSFGAGASFSAGFIYSYLQGCSLEEMARFATAAASIKVSRPGFEPPELAEINKLASELKVMKHT
ncbi:MAG: carbohydrate kinase family protein [Calothrix sp. FI2-JRJ7]|jgi:ribokinase|nr:carbohydrate kinase family protein [Calothrix sp. FI2-JRJ7]